uniref:Uncharacterized protein n=1 Tax=Anguilla anguilla TaxID=7936 RepID=A0A0E9UTV9_ANGAN
MYMTTLFSVLKGIELFRFTKPIPSPRHKHRCS